MGRYSAGVAATATGATAGAPLAALKSAVGGPELILVELWIVNLNGPATVSSLSLRRTTNAPVATTTALGQAYDPDDGPATGLIETAWSTVPAASTALLRRLMNMQGANFNNTSLYWADEAGLRVSAGGDRVCVFQDSAPSSALQTLMTFVWDE